MSMVPVADAIIFEGFTDQVIEVLTGPRVEEYTAQLLDENDQMKRVLYEFSGGSYEQNAFADIRTGGTLDLKSLATGPQGTDIDFGSDRIMLWYTANNVTWPLGVFIIEAPAQGIDDEETSISVSVKVMDKLAVLSQDAVDGSYSLPAGTVITEAVRALIISAGEVRMAITDDSRTLPAGRVWEAGTTKLAICNDLLAMINYGSLWCDGYGTFRAEPYVEPANRPISYTFATGQIGLHVPEWQRERDWFDVPNKMVLVTQGDDQTPGLVGVAENADGNDNLPQEFSEQERGRWIVRTQTGVEAADQATLDQMALLALQAASTKVTNLSVTHAMMPLWTNERVAFDTPLYTGTATISKFNVTLQPGSLASATWREVNGGLVEIPR